MYKNDKAFYPEIDKTLQFRFIKIDEIKNCFINEICQRELLT